LRSGDLLHSRHVPSPMEGFRLLVRGAVAVADAGRLPVVSVDYSGGGYLSALPFLPGTTGAGGVFGLLGNLVRWTAVAGLARLCWQRIAMGMRRTTTDVPGSLTMTAEQPGGGSFRFVLRDYLGAIAYTATAGASLRGSLREGAEGLPIDLNPRPRHLRETLRGLVWPWTFAAPQDFPEPQNDGPAVGLADLLAAGEAAPAAPGEV
ncbi:unnamed protein product, partial [Amoebophrya sp. A120]